MSRSASKPSRIKRAGQAGAVVAALACGAIAKHEGLRLISYQDVIGVWTACYGETKGIRAGMAFTKQECDQKLLTRLDYFGQKIEACVPSLADERKTSPHRYVAHLSLAYNIGWGGYCKSSIARLENAGRSLEACDFFLKYNRAGGVVWKGLTKRRQEEREWCRKG